MTLGWTMPFNSTTRRNVFFAAWFIHWIAILLIGGITYGIYGKANRCIYRDSELNDRLTMENVLVLVSLAIGILAAVTAFIVNLPNGLELGERF